MPVALRRRDLCGFRSSSTGSPNWAVYDAGLRARGSLTADADTGRIVASVLTDKDADDGSQVQQGVTGAHSNRGVCPHTPVHRAAKRKTVYVITRDTESARGLPAAVNHSRSFSERAGRAPL
jgi:hypothetical protein